MWPYCMWLVCEAPDWIVNSAALIVHIICEKVSNSCVSAVKPVHPESKSWDFGLLLVLCVFSSIWRLQWHCASLSGSAEWADELVTAAQHWHTAWRRFLLGAMLKHSIYHQEYTRMSCDFEVEVGKMAVLCQSCFIVFVAKRLALQFPPSFMYKVTLTCTVNHNSLKRALDWAEMPEFYPWHRSIWFLASVVTRIFYHDRIVSSAALIVRIACEKVSNSCAHLRTCPCVCSQSCMVRSLACTLYLFKCLTIAAVLCLLVRKCWTNPWISNSSKTLAHSLKEVSFSGATFKYSTIRKLRECHATLRWKLAKWKCCGKLLYGVCCEEIGIAIVGINYFSDLSNISTGITQWKIPKQGYVTRNYPTPQVVVYYHHPIADWFRNLPHWSWHEVYANVYELWLLSTGCDFHQSATVYHRQAFAVIVLFTVNAAEPIDETSKILRPKIFT